MNQYGTYRCSCKDGYNLDADFKGCTEMVLNISFLMKVFFSKIRKSFDQTKDIDECFFGSECPDIAICRNFDGSYNCECPKGQFGSLLYSYWSLLGILI